MLNTTLSEKILMMSAWKGMGMKYFPARELLNQAQTIEIQKQTGQLWNYTEMGTFPMMPQQQLAAPASNGPIKVTLADGTVVEGTLHTEKPEDKLDKLTKQISVLANEVHDLSGFTQRTHDGLIKLEATIAP